ncbi:MAG TPA: hypothetical protein EYG82_06260 [Sulfurovum sp.]|nr:hypothetical protein [Sulfurovum sp.]
MIEPADAPATERKLGYIVSLEALSLVSIFMRAQLQPASYAPRLTPPLITMEKFISLLLA